MFKIFSALIQALHGGRGRAVAANHQTLRPLRQARVGRCCGAVSCAVVVVVARTPVYNSSENWPLYNRNEPQYYIWNGNIKGGRKTPWRLWILALMLCSGTGEGPRATPCAFWNEFIPMLRQENRTGAFDRSLLTWHWTCYVVISSDHQMWQPQDRVQASAPLQSRPWEGEYLRVVDTHLILCT